jgi:putative ABC transport system ATP-binding protein
MSGISNQAVLNLKVVRKVFSRGTIDEVTALDGINLDVHDQDFITIIGSHGFDQG